MEMRQSVSVLKGNFWWRNGLRRWKDRAVLSFQFQSFSSLELVPWNWPPCHPHVWVGGVQVLYAGVQWVRHDTIHHPYHAVCLGTNPGRGYSQKALFPRSVYLFVFIRKGRALGNEWLRDPSALHICVWSGSQDAGTLRLSGGVFWCMLLAARVP